MINKQHEIVKGGFPPFTIFILHMPQNEFRGLQ